MKGIWTLALMAQGIKIKYHDDEIWQPIDYNYMHSNKDVTDYSKAVSDGKKFQLKNFT